MATSRNLQDDLQAALRSPAQQSLLKRDNLSAVSKCPVDSSWTYDHDY